MSEFSEPIIVVAGPTAIGKSEYALELAHRYPGSEIVSADAFQVYRGLDIGTGKLLSSDWEGVPHHLIDTKSWAEAYSVVEFLIEAEKIFEKQKLLGHKTIVCGGTGYYLYSLVYGAKFSGDTISSSHTPVESDLTKSDDGDEMWNRLNLLDPVYASQVHAHNVRRVSRALEIIMRTGRPLSEQRVLESQPRSDVAMVVLNDEREKIYERINTRVDAMMDKGWISEVERLVAEGFSDTYLAYGALGYSDIHRFLLGGIAKDSMIELVKMKTRRFAKRQLTWLRRFSHAKWV
jgi:tRNA dimethylallyltransferase